MSAHCPRIALRIFGSPLKEDGGRSTVMQLLILGKAATAMVVRDEEGHMVEASSEMVGCTSTFEAEILVLERVVKYTPY